MKYRQYVLMNDDIDANGGGEAVVEAPPVAEVAPQETMLDAINTAVPDVEAVVEPEVKPEVKEPVPDTPEELTKMPEGLSRPAQDRFQKLANTNKELTQRYESVVEAVEPFKQALQENGVRKDQFEQAAGIVGMFNRGDFQGALKALDEQRRFLSIAMGKPLAGVDALEEHPDLRGRVDNGEIHEIDAIELARGRIIQRGTQQQNQQRQQQQFERQEQQRLQQRQQLDQQAGLKAVDAFSAEMKATDLDFSAIEAKLLPVLPQLLAGVPPSQYVTKIKSLYTLVKQNSAPSRSSGSTALRPTGTASPATAPKSMYDAMFGSK